MIEEHDHWAVLDDLPCGTRFLRTARGVHPRKAGHPGVKVKKLDRAPTDHDTFDGKKLVHRAISQARADREALLAHMTRSELVDHILALGVDQRAIPED